MDVVALGLAKAAIKKQAATDRATSDTRYAPIGGGSALPSWAGTRSGKYDVSRGVYVPVGTSTLKTQAAFGKAATGGGFTRIVALGDSTIAGFGAIRSTSSWPAQLANLLSNFGIPKSGGGIALAGGYNPPDTRWTLAGGFALNLGTVTSLNGFMSAKATANGATATFTSDVSGTIVDIHYQDNPGTWTYSIDGGAAVPVAAGSSQTNKLVSITGLPNTAHTVVITTTSAAAVSITGAEIRNATGASITNLGIGSTGTTFWSGTAWYNAINLATYLAPQLTLICLGINDRNNALSTAAFTTQLTAIVAAMKASGDVMLLVPNRINVGATSQPGIAEDPYYSAIYDVADSQLCPVIDTPARLGTFAQANAAGLMVDTYHPNGSGYATIARAVAGYLAA